MKSKKYKFKKNNKKTKSKKLNNNKKSIKNNKKKTYLAYHYFSTTNNEDALIKHNKILGLTKISSLINREKDAKTLWTIFFKDQNLQVCYWQATNKESINRALKPFLKYYSKIVIHDVHPQIKFKL